MALNWDYMTTTTREKFVPKVQDNIYDKSAALKTLLIDGRVREYLKGGRKIVEPLRYEKMGASGSYSGWDTFDVTPPDNITAAEQTWGNYYASIAISGDDEDQNMGDSQVVSLLQERTQEAEDKMYDDLANDLFQGGGSKEIVGFNTMIDTGTYGGIAGATLTNRADREIYFEWCELLETPNVKTRAISSQAKLKDLEGSETNVYSLRLNAMAMKQHERTTHNKCDDIVRAA